jgi:hypothetical protein
MMEPEIKESHSSWRVRWQLMITEGRKVKISNKALQIGLWLVGLFVLIFQGASLYKPSVKKRAEIIFVPPDLKLASLTTYVPQVMNREQEMSTEKAKARELSLARLGRRPQIERITSVNLGAKPGIPAGSEVLVTLTSGGTNGMVKAILTEALKSEGEALLPSGTVLLGSGSSSEDRLFMEFTKAILPDRTTIKINALAYDKDDRILGVKGKKISDYAFKLAASSGLIFLGGMADGMREEVNLNPGERRRPSVRDSALTGVATATSEVGKGMLEKMKASGNRVEVAHSTSVLVIFDEVSSQ